MSQSAVPSDASTVSNVEVSESAFEFLLAEILCQPAYSSTNSATEKDDVHVHRLDILGYDVGYR